MIKLFLLFMIINYDAAFAMLMESPKDEMGSHFVGQISRLNPTAKLMRIRTKFANIKFLNRRDRMEFWNDTYPDQKCNALVEGRTNDYLLLRIPQYELCVKRVHFTTGSTIHFMSDDLAENVKIVKELVQILLKKRLAMQAKKDRHHKELITHVDKVDALNKRFEILRQKLEIEWQSELSNLEEDKARTFTDYKNAEARLNEIDTKLEAYRIENHNLTLDRWSLDPALYIKK